MRLSALGGWQGSGNTSSVFGQWTPSLQMQDFRLGIDLGATALRARGDRVFLATEYAFTADMNVSSHWSAEVLAGAQSWFNDENKTALLTGAGASWFPEQKWLGVFDRLVISYAVVHHTTIAHQLRIGLGVEL